VSAYPSAEVSRGSLVREGWAASATTTPAGNRPAWVVRATKCDRTVEGRGVTKAEAWFDACRGAFQGGRT
jgi:hypothetical protein